MDVVSGFLTLT